MSNGETITKTFSHEECPSIFKARDLAPWADVIISTRDGFVCSAKAARAAAFYRNRLADMRAAFARAAAAALEA